MIVLSQFSFSQDIPLKLFAEDSEGRRDTITFGLNSQSTIDIDIEFNEIDIYEIPIDTLDLRIIQRDSVEHNCLRETNRYS